MLVGALLADLAGSVIHKKKTLLEAANVGRDFNEISVEISPPNHTPFHNAKSTCESISSKPTLERGFLPRVTSHIEYAGNLECECRFINVYIRKT